MAERFRGWEALTLAMIAIAIVVVLAFTNPFVEAQYSDHPPCQPPAVGPPGGCLLPDDHGR